VSMMHDTDLTHDGPTSDESSISGTAANLRARRSKTLA
jgi:hypothetical protein